MVQFVRLRFRTALATGLLVTWVDTLHGPALSRRPLGLRIGPTDTSPRYPSTKQQRAIADSKGRSTSVHNHRNPSSKILYNILFFCECLCGIHIGISRINAQQPSHAINCTTISCLARS